MKSWDVFLNIDHVLPEIEIGSSRYKMTATYFTKKKQ